MRSNPIFRNLQIAGETISWGDPALSTFVNDCQFESCDITITCPARGINIGNTLFRNCIIRVKRAFTDYQFFHAGFEDCRFLGKFPGCEFGYRDASSLRGRMQGYIRNCDFTQAFLNLVQFNRTDTTTLRLPPWPHFLVTSAAAFTEIAEFAGDAEWTVLGKIGWSDAPIALVILYRTDGRHGFRMPADDALAVLRRYPKLAAIAAG